MAESSGAAESSAHPRQRIAAAVVRIAREHVPVDAPVPVAIERPRDRAHGDYATNAALALAKAARRNPRELAGELAAAVAAELADLVETPEIAGPGFIN